MWRILKTIIICRIACCIELFVFTHALSSRINTHLQKTLSCGLFLTCRRKNPHCFKHGIVGYMIIENLFTWAVSAKTGADMNDHHLQAHVSCLLSHRFEHASTQFGLEGCQGASHMVRSGPLFPAQAWPQYTSDFKLETLYISALLVRNSLIPTLKG